MGIYGFHKRYGYGLRSLAEAQTSRIKRCIGATLLTREIASQQSERVIIANLVNPWNTLVDAICRKWIVASVASELGPFKHCLWHAEKLQPRLQNICFSG
jgi:hypothetical protein